MKTCFDIISIHVNQDQLNQKPKTNIQKHETCVLWTWAYHTILIFTIWDLNSNPNYGYLSLLLERNLQADLIQNLIQRAWLQWVLDIIFDTRALESPCECFQTILLKLSLTSILINDLKLRNTRLLVHITTWVNHHQN